MSGATDRARELISAGVSAYAALASSEEKTSDLWASYLNADDRVERLARETLPAALDFADAVEAALREPHSSMTWTLVAKAHAAFLAALDRATGGGA